MNFHPRILTARQQKLLKKLGGLAKAEGFYLAGGTALALQIGNVAHLLYSLAYFDDADQEKMPVMITRTTWPKIKKIISEQVNSYVVQL